MEVDSTLTVNSRLRLASTWLALVVFLVVVVGTRVLWGMLNYPDAYPIWDFVEYWAAGCLNLDGLNPYDPDLVLQREQAEDPGITQAVMMWNPPWTLTYVMPYSLLPRRPAQLIWFFVHVGVVAASVSWLWRVVGGETRYWWVPLVISLSFVPTFIVLLIGQISVLLLLGGVGLIACLKDERPFLAGVMTIFLAIKPHLFLLVWLCLGVWIVAQRQWRVLWGGITVGVVTTLIPMIWNPLVLQQYYEELVQRPPSQWMTPTLGTLLRLIFGWDYFRLQFVALGLGLVWLGWYGDRWRRSGRPWDWTEQLPRLMLMSLLVAPYGVWLMDLVVLLLPVVMLSARLMQQENRAVLSWAMIVYGLINLAALTSFAFELDLHWYFWMVPSLFIAYVTLEWSMESIPPIKRRDVPPVLVSA